MMVGLGIFLIGAGAVAAQRPRRLLALYLTTLAIFPSYWRPFEIPAISQLAPQQGLAIGALVVLPMVALASRDRRSATGELLLLTMLLPAVVLIWSVGLLEHRALSSAARGIFVNLIDMAAPFLIGLVAVRSAQDERQLARWIVIPAVGVAALTIAEYLFNDALAWSFFRGLYTSSYDVEWAPFSLAGRYRVQANFAQPIFLSLYLAAATIFATSLAGTSGGARRCLLLALSAVFALASALTLSRGPLLGLLLGLAVFTLISSGVSRLVLGAGLVLGLGVIGTAAWLALGNPTDEGLQYWLDFLQTLTGTASAGVGYRQTANLNYRFDVVTAGLDIVSQAPLFGYGDLLVDGSKPINDVVNVFVQIGFVSGLAGVVSCFLLLLVVLGYALSLIRSLPTGARTEAAALAAVGTLVLVGWSGSSWPGQFAQVGWVVFGALVGWAACRRSERSPAPVQEGVATVQIAAGLAR